MKAQLFCSLAFALAVTAAAPHAQAQYSPEYDKCIVRSHGSTVQSGLCAQGELTHQDDRLNKAYQQLMTQYPAGDSKRIELRDDERAWLKKRDYDCKINGDTIDNDCLLHKTAERADFLEHKLKF